ncbi:MAG: precorrin-2 C(20)-methyltransferase [Alphaproteobacteria bacterium]|jgi:precorrin-2/cobalt-factor-2 C20-methyltransferase
MTGILHGVGVGPGDPELITLKALRLLRDSPVIAWPAPLTGESMARAIAAPHINARGPDNAPVEIAIRMPMVEERFPAQSVYDTAAQEIATHLEAGRDVVALCEGDPFFYGSFMYLFGRLAERFPVEVTPGVSSLTASAAALAAPLAARNDVLTILPAPLPTADMKQRLQEADAVAIIKIGRQLDKVKAVLAELGLLENARYIEHATMGSQQILPVTDVTSAPYFSMILVHKRGDAWRLSDLQRGSRP